MEEEEKIIIMSSHTKNKLSDTPIFVKKNTKLPLNNFPLRSLNVSK